MTARIIDGKVIASELRARVAGEVARVQRERGLTPGLAVVDLYIFMKLITSNKMLNSFFNF